MKPEEKRLYFKFRKLENIEHLLDMVIRGRLYAAKLSELNDPMEGFIRAPNFVSRERYGDWEAVLERARIASFSKSSDNPLMWAHYADGGRGCLIAFTILDSVEVKDVEYGSELTWSGDKLDDSLAVSFLTRKQLHWEREAEARVILMGNENTEHFVPINVEFIEFGPKVNSERFKLLSHVIKLCRPDVGVFQSLISGKVNPTFPNVLHATILDPQVDYQGCKECYYREAKINGISMYQRLTKK